VERTIHELAEQTSLDVRAAELVARERKIAREEQRIAAEKQAFARREKELANPRDVVVTIPAGSSIVVEFRDALSSETNKPGDLFAARIYEDVYQDGVLVMPAGTGIEGQVTDAQDSKRIGGRAKLPSGADVPVYASFADETKGQAVLIEPGTVIDLVLIEDVPVTVR
jgi:hypothetical protein